MANTMDKLAKELKNAMTASDERKPKPYDAQAEVLRVEDGVAWVHIPGGVEETPVRLTINAKKGDMVNIHVANGSAWITGNGTNPPTDDATAIHANETAISAHEAAEKAWSEAESAHEAADQAWAYADSAHQAADRAESEAVRAYNEAERATGYANDALTQLSTVEDVVDTLNWITEHGTMTLTTDTQIDPTHVYFVVDPNGDYVVGSTHYSIVTEPDVSELNTYYVLTIDEAVSNYVASHLALTDDGLYVVKDNQGYKVLLANDGLKVYDAGGHLVSTFGENITYDSARPQTIGNQSTYIKWYDSNNDNVADSIEIAGANVNIASSVTIGGMPTKVSDLTNDSDYQTGNEVSGAISTATNGLLSGVTTKDRYYLSTSSSSATGGSWQDTVPTWSSGKYIWTRVATTKTTSSGTNTTYSTAVYDSALTKALSDANSAASTETTTKQYYLSTSTSSATGGSWSGNVPTWSSGKYIWIRFKIDKTTVGGTTSTSYSPSENGQYDSALTTALSTASSAQSAANGAVASTVSCYYRSTTQSPPSKPTASTSIGTSANTDNAWEYVMPQPKRGCYFYTCEEYTPVSGTKTYSTVRSLDNATYTSKWCSASDNVYIDGGSIYANSVTTDKIASNAITAEKIAANSITANKIRIGDYNNYITVNENDASSFLTANLSISDGWVFFSATSGNIWLSPSAVQWTSEGEVYRITGTVKTPADGRAIFTIAGRDSSGNYVTGNGATVNTTANTEVTFSKTIEISSAVAVCARANIFMYFYTGSSGSTIQNGYFKNLKCERMSGSSLIVDGAITTDKLDANAVTAAKISANSIGARHLTISDNTNLATANEMYESSLPDYSQPTAISGGYLVKKVATQQYLMVTNYTPSDFKTNDELYYEFYGKAATAGSVSFCVWGYDGTPPTHNNVISNNVSISLTTSEQLFTGVIKLSNTNWTTKTHYLIGFSDGRDTKSQIYIRKLVVRRKSGGELIVDGAISASKLSISDNTNLVRSNELYPNSLPTLINNIYKPVISGGYLVKKDPTQSYILFNENQPSAFKQNDEIYYEFYAKAASATTISVGVYGYSALTDANAATSNSTTDISITTTETKYSGTIKLSNSAWNTANGYNIAIYDKGSTKVQMYFRKVIFRRKSAGELIVDGSITTEKLYTGAVTIGKIDTSDSSTASAILNSNIQVGGRNYAKTDFTVTSPITRTQTGITATLVGPSEFMFNGTATAGDWAFNTGKIFGGTVLKAGTYKLWVDKPNVGIRIGYGSDSTWFAQAGAGCTKDNPYTLTITTEQEYWYVPTTVANITYSNLDVHLMVEAGNKVTDWSPAPEDALNKKDASIEVIDSTTKLFKNLAVLNTNDNPYTGYLGIITPINPNRMNNVHITGYNYANSSQGNGRVIDISIGFYNYSTSINNATFSNNGDFDVGEVRIAKYSSSDNRAVIILGKYTTEWRYPKILVDEALIGYTNPPDSYMNGWSITKLNTTIPSTYVQTISCTQYNASKVATTYVTDINGTGIRVHPANTQNNSVLINASGMTVYKGGTEDANSVAFYGDTARIGKTSTGNVTIASNSVSINKASAEIAKFYADSGSSYIDVTNKPLIVNAGDPVESSDGVGGGVDNIIMSGSNVSICANRNANNAEAELMVDAGNSDDTHTAVVVKGDYLQMYPSEGQASTFWLIGQTAPSGSGTTAVWHASSNGNYGVYRSSSSSRRYKEDIMPVEDDRLDPHKLYDLPVVQFKYKEGYFLQDDPYEENRINLIGFIAEDVLEHYPQAAIMDKEEAETWDARYLIPPMLKLIQEQNERITELERRLL